MSQTETWTIGRLLTWTADFLKRNGSESPRLEAEVLLAHVRGCPRIALYTAFDELAGEELRSAFRELVKRRATGMPVAYLVGYREFYSLSFQVSPAVLIPRPETEFVVIQSLDLLKKTHAGRSPLEIADVGTGSGVIAVCLARSLPNSRVTAIDRSAAALEMANANVQKHGMATQIVTLHSDLFDALPAERRFDLIASNPPYVKQDELATLARDVRDFEPQAALVAGPRGLEVLEALVRQATTRLEPGGWLVVEIHPCLETEVRQLFGESCNWSSLATTRDLAGHPRVMSARWRA
ncbi:MAG: peptide chain release factor N(5)-glutamine methyltransferase [Planctomycetes bacterium]|nr:peptide chain release factor N(5)-glutamine methyltransferase [Planctomycetota bacterium]